LEKIIFPTVTLRFCTGHRCAQPFNQHTIGNFYALHAGDSA